MVNPVSERSVILVPEEHNNGILGVMYESNKQESEIFSIVWYGNESPPSFPQDKEKWNKCYDYTAKSLLVAYPEELHEFKHIIKQQA